MSFSLYVHIPYCQSKCPYCDFNSYAAQSWPEADYVRALTAEMVARAGEPAWAGRRVKTIFFGGGTPSLFAPDSIRLVIDAADRFFGIDQDREITLEANPGTLDREKLFGFRAAGVNRLSIGAQSFDPGILGFLGRIHSANDTRKSVRLAHEAGFERLNLDLMFAIPGQQPGQVRQDIAEAVALAPDHISAYNLTFEEGTAFFTEMKRGRIRPLPTDDQAAMYDLVRSELPRCGYPMYEISNYARPGHEARHNLSYWHAESYLGLGAGAHSCALDEGACKARRWWNQRLPGRYINEVRERGTAEDGSELIEAPLLQGEFVFLNLRLRCGFELDEFEQRFGERFEARFGSLAEELESKGLLVRDRGHIFLSDRGLEMADSVFAEFL
jgi:oxygen-independent coproporphyrinogen-3 oxidase